VVVQPQRRLAGRGIIVTGASSGIGWAVAERVAAERSRVRACGRRRDALDALAVATAGVEPYAADLAGSAGRQAVIDEAKRRIGRVDGLVHGAGTVRRGDDVRATTGPTFGRFLDDNLTSTFRLVRAAFAGITANATGPIVLVGSQLSEIAIAGTRRTAP
jgi:NADP-dependent 3-hydroxy acid dehydrogenase YdfG